jgi:DNA segregation ATPase FtsK/SpoIIIE, S-DNA-T family
MSTTRRPIGRSLSSARASQESIKDILKDVMQRRFKEVLGLVMLALSVALAIALASWSVRDPSLNNAVEGPVRNWLGTPGAIVSDIVIQLFGIAILALMFPVIRWSINMMKHRKQDRFLLRMAAYVLGVGSAAAFASLLPRADSWPLPTGLGGAIGDSIERLPLYFLGSSGMAKAFAALLFIAFAIIALHFSVSRDPSRVVEEAEDESKIRKHSDMDEDEHSDDEPSRALVVVGAVVSGAVLGGRAIANSVRSFREGTGRKIADGTRQMVEKATRDDQTAYAMAGTALAGTSLAANALHHHERREPSLRQEPVVARDTMTEVAPPVYHRPAAARVIAPAAAAVAAPVVQASVPQAGYGAAVSALQMAAKRRLGLLKEEPIVEAPAPVAYDNARPGERAAIEALQAAARRRLAGQRLEPVFDDQSSIDTPMSDIDEPAFEAAPVAASVQNHNRVNAATSDQSRISPRVAAPLAPPKQSKREFREAQPDMLNRNSYELPPLSLLNEPKRTNVVTISEDALEQNARLLEGVLDDFGVRGEIINVRPGPVVTLYELEPAPGTKSSRVIGLADDIARSMSAISARVAVVPGRNAIGIELPNQRRETVYFRELIGSQEFEKSPHKLALSLGKTIGGEMVIAELAKMPHVLVAGTTGSGKSVAINTMILSLLYKLTPEQCRLIMIDPKMLELSIYEGIPHLLTPVVTDPKKAVVALKWAVREMEDRYKKMSKIGVRNIDGFNARVTEARKAGEVITRTVQTGFDKETGEIIYSEEEMSLDTLPYIVVLIDEMADLMMVAGKDIEGAVQRLAQMARAAGIHVIMATQRPSVDVITGTIKANFPTRISFQVTSKIDSRTILGEMGAEQLLGQGDMLHMAGGGRISRVHGPFVSDEEVERVVRHLKLQGKPQYLESITREEDEDGESEDGAVFDKGEFGEEGGDLYDQAVRIVVRDKKASTSYIQRRLQIGYNRAASLMERMENEGVVGPANHAGKREILMEGAE